MVIGNIGNSNSVSAETRFATYAQCGNEWCWEYRQSRQKCWANKSGPQESFLDCNLFDDCFLEYWRVNSTYTILLYSLPGIMYFNLCGLVSNHKLRDNGISHVSDYFAYTL